MMIFDAKNITVVSTIFGTIILVAGAFTAFDARYAKAEEVKKIELRLEQKILEDRSQSFQQRIWSLEDRYGIPLKPATPPAVREQYRQVIQEKQITDKKLDTIQLKVEKN